VKANSHPVHILFICSGLNVAGGLERMVVSLANLLSEKDYTVSLLILHTSKKSFYPINEKVCISRLNLNFGINSTRHYLNRKIELVQDIISVKKEIRRISPEIIITTEYPQTSALVAGQLHQEYKIIAWQHSSYYQPKSFLWKKLADFSYKKVQAIVCLNADEEKVFTRFNDNVITIPNFIELQTNCSLLNTNTILTIAHLTNIKGIDLLIKAARLIFTINKNCKWRIIGDGPLKKMLKNTIEENELFKNLEHHEPGSVLLSNEYLHSAIYVMPSRRETFGMVLLEAMSYGVPCVAFNCETGPGHIITHNIDGLLVEKENPEKLAAAICSLIEDEEKRRQMGKAAFENVKRFSGELVIKKWEELFHRLLNPGSAKVTPSI
jgi:glycosyltransferase involved in cell wall biosynthesis